eukprot:8013313-Pyramimonas_sp.AAC.1
MPAPPAGGAGERDGALVRRLQRAARVPQRRQCLVVLLRAGAVGVLRRAGRLRLLAAPQHVCRNIYHGEVTRVSGVLSAPMPLLAQEDP